MWGKNVLHTVKQAVIGAVVGMGGITPGFSGGILAVAFGVYHDMIAALGNLFKDPKKSILYLLPLGIGMMVGVVIMSNAIEWLMLNWRTPFLFLIIGLVLGGVPNIIKAGNKTNGFHPKYLIAAAAGFAFIIVLSLIASDATAGETQTFSNPLFALLCGAILSISTVIPGLGTSFLLIYLGWYEPLLAAINNLDVVTLLLVGVGFIVAVLFLAKAVQKVFDKYGEYAYYAILGFSLASIIMIFPEVQFNVNLLLYIALAAGGFMVTRLMTKEWGQKKMEEQKPENL